MVREPRKHIREDQYLEEYSREFVDKWDELIDWEKRYKAEGEFFRKELEKHGVKTVLDIACGTGFHTINLVLDRFDVVGADGSPSMLAKARENAESYGLSNLKFVEAQWTTLTEVFPEKSFDALVCLGNAFTHLFIEADRIKALREIFKLVNDGGVAIIDHRNYDSILDRGFSSKHRYYYAGSTVEVETEYISTESVKFLYKYSDGSVHHLTLCPIRQEYVTRLLRQAGFTSVKRYGDFKADYDFYEPDFIVQVSKKG